MALGLNCLNPEWVTPLLASAVGVAPTVPRIVYPNTGETWDHEKGFLVRDDLVEC